MTQNLSYEIKVTAFEKTLKHGISAISAIRAIANEDNEISAHTDGQELIKVNYDLFAVCSAHFSNNDFPILKIKDFITQ